MRQPSGALTKPHGAGFLFRMYGFFPPLSLLHCQKKPGPPSPRQRGKKDPQCKGRKGGPRRGRRFDNGGKKDPQQTARRPCNRGRERPCGWGGRVLLRWGRGVERGTGWPGSWPENPTTGAKKTHNRRHGDPATRARKTCGGPGEGFFWAGFEFGMCEFFPPRTTTDGTETLQRGGERPCGGGVRVFLQGGPGERNREGKGRE